MIKNFTGTSGRLDIIARCLLAAFSFGKQNILFHTVLQGPPDPPKSLSFIGNQLEDLPTDEIGVAHLFQTLLNPQNTKRIKGITIAKTSFLELATELAQEGPVFVLKEKSLPLWDYLQDLRKNNKLNVLSFILSDDIDLEPGEEEFLIRQLHAIRTSLGSQSYLASHCIIFLLMKFRTMWPG